MTNADISKLAGRVLLTDILSEASEIKEEIQEKVKPAVNSFDFASRIPEIEEEEFEEFEAPKTPAQVEPVYEEEDYDADKNARGLVHTLNSIDSMVLTSATFFKLRADFGGSKMLKKMKAARNKSYTTIELTPLEKKLVERLQVFENKLNDMSSGIHPKPAETNRLIVMATDYCEDTHFKMSSATAFWANYAGSVVERLTKILMS